MKKRVQLGAAIVLGAFVVGIAFSLLRPISIRNLTSSPTPATGYADAVERIEALRAQKG